MRLCCGKNCENCAIEFVKSTNALRDALEMLEGHGDVTKQLEKGQKIFPKISKL